MSLWRRKRPAWPVRPEGISDQEWLAQLFEQLTDDIADDIDDDGNPYSWSRQLRKCAEWVRAGSPTGLHRFFKLSNPNPWNTFNEQLFTDNGHLLRSLEARESGWGSTGALRGATRARPKAPSDRGRRAGPAKRWPTKTARSSRPKTMAAATPNRGHRGRFTARRTSQLRRWPSEPDGSCVRYRYRGDERWLADRLHEHHPQLHLEPRPPGFGRP